MEFGFFEPILLCFPNLEFLGRMRFSSEVAWSPEHPKTRETLGKSLESMGGGYKEHAQSLVRWHRHALSHELRPDGEWTYDLNTGDKYGVPARVGGQLYLNVPHFIDTCLLEVEKVCAQLCGDDSEEVMEKFSAYISKRFPVEGADGARQKPKPSRDAGCLR